MPDQTVWPGLALAELPASVTQAVAQIQAAALPSQSLYPPMNTAPVTPSVVTVGARVTGLSTATEAANSTIAGSARTDPNYTAPRTDLTYRINGPFAHNNLNAGVDCGSNQYVTPTGTGPTDAYANYQFDVLALDATGQAIEIWGRDMGITQYLTIWVSRNGGPFLPHVNPDVGQALASTGDGEYWLLPLNFNSPGKLKVILEGDALTFGGVRWNSTHTTVRYPSWSAGRMLVRGDSYDSDGDSVRAMASWPVKAARDLGLDLHLDAYPGTGFSANSAGNAYKYGDPAREGQVVTPYFSGGEQPLVIVNQGSINDDLYGPSGTGQFTSAQTTTDIDALLSSDQANYPNALIINTHPMHPCRNNATMNAADIVVGALIDALLPAHSLPAAYDGVSDIPLTGNGNVSAPTGVGTADILSANDSLHPTAAGGSAIALGARSGIPGVTGIGLAAFIKAAVLANPRQYSGPQNTPSPIVVAAAQAAAATAQAAVALANEDYVLIKDFGWVDLTGLAAGTFVLMGGTATNPGTAVAPGAAGTAKATELLSPSYYNTAAPPGKNPYVRLRVSAFTNATAPACNFAFSLVARGAVSGAGAPAVAGGGAAANPAIGVSGAPFNTPAADTPLAGTSGDIAFTQALLWYVPQLVTSAAMAAGSVMSVNLRLEFHFA